MQQIEVSALVDAYEQELAAVTRRALIAEAVVARLSALLPEPEPEE